MRTRRAATAALLAALWGVAAAQPDDWAGLPPGDGRHVTYYTCQGCHSARLVAQQRLSRERWDHLLDWMVKEQGMAELKPELRSTILDYLAMHLAPESDPGGRPQPGVSPFSGVQPLGAPD